MSGLETHIEKFPKVRLEKEGPLKHGQVQVRVNTAPKWSVAPYYEGQDGQS